MGSVYNRGTKSKPNWWIKYKDANDKWRYSKIGPSRPKAVQILRKVEGDIISARYGLPDETAPTLGDILFDDMADRWLESRRHLRSVDDDRLRLRKHMRPVFGKRRLRDISTRDVDEFLSRKQDGLAASTVAKLRCALHKLYDDAIKWKLAAENPVRRARKIRVTRDDEQFTYLDREEIERLLSCEEIPEGSRALYATAILAGLRLGELYCLRWDDIDLDRRQIAVRRSFKGPTKSGKPRHVPIQPQLRRILSTWKRQCPETEEGLVFPNRKGKRRSRYHDYGFAKHLTAAKCRRIRFHDLRHTCAALYVMSGVPIRTVQKILGHASVTTTERYAHLAPGHLLAEVAGVKLDLERGVVLEFPAVREG